VNLAARVGPRRCPFAQCPADSVHHFIVKVDDPASPKEALPIRRQVAAVELDAAMLHKENPVLAEDVEVLAARFSELCQEFLDRWLSITHKAQQRS
jgi:hypothetical protein